MKVLYIGVYRDGTGWGNAARDYILALDAAGVDVVCRPLKLNGVQAELPERILELEAKPSRGVDVVIQHVLPHQMDYNGLVRNIGLYATESSNFKSSAWADRLNCMDEAWVINRQMVEAARVSGVNIPLHVVPHATDITRFQQSYEPLEALKPYKNNGDFLFYFIGEAVRRKNLPGLLKAFHTEFSRNEPVQLVIKANRSGMSPGDTTAYLKQYCEEVKRGLKKPGGCKDEIIITDRLNENGLMRLHAAGDCFVLPSCGEAWGIPAFDAMAMGKTPIVTGWGGFVDYLSNETGWLADYRLEPAFGAIETFVDLHTGNEEWAYASTMDLRRCMRQAFEDEQLRAAKSLKGIERAYDFSYAAVGRTMRELLHGQAKPTVAEL